jgi:hypothetical protein
MVLNKNIRKMTGTLLFVFFVLLFSCEEIQPLIINCSKCKNDEPVNAEIEIKLSTFNSPTHIKIYEGNLEDSILYSSLSTYESSATIALPLNKKFTFTARYYQAGGNYYYAVNSTIAHVKYTEDQCDNPCYYIYDNTVNLKLKYTK